jgi:DNA polymerase-3 subunit epsilon
MTCFPTGRYYPGIAEYMTVDDRRWHDMRVAVVDLETTGFDPLADRVVEIAVVVFSGGREVRRDNWLVDPCIPIPAEATAVHGISNEDVAGKPYWHEVAKMAQQAIGEAIPCAYNSKFEDSFFPQQSPWIDPLVWSRELDSHERVHKLEVACKRYGIAVAKAHRAWADAEATGKLLYALAPRMPTRYSEVIRIQGELARRQEAEFDYLARKRGYAKKK